MYELVESAGLAVFKELARSEPAVAERVLPPRLPARKRGFMRRAGSYFMDKIGFTALANDARAAMLIPPQPLPAGMNPIRRACEVAEHEPDRMRALLADPRNAADLAILARQNIPSLERTVTSAEFEHLTPARKAAQTAGHFGVGPSKGAQIASSDERLPPDQRRIYSVFRSGGAPSRTQNQAQRLIDDLHGPGEYRIGNVAGVGTIGDTYHAVRTADAQPVIIKMVKANVSHETLDAESRLVSAAIGVVYDDPRTCEQKRHRARSFYAQCHGELDFSAEARNATDLALGAKRFDVARVLAVGIERGSREARSLVLERAPGISLEDVQGLLETWRCDPANYARAHANIITEHPWCADPASWAHQVPNAYRKTANEQTLRRITGGMIVSHGDPHLGNVFVTADARGKIRATLIDTGAIVRRTPERTMDHLGLFVNAVLGNAKGVANAIVELAENVPEAERKGKRDFIAAQLDDYLFKQRVNLTDCAYYGRLIDKVIDDSDLRIPASDLTFFKAQFQVMTVYRELSKLAGVRGSNYVKDSLGDIVVGLTKLSVRRPRLALKRIAPAMVHLARERRAAMRCLLQFLLKKPEPVADGLALGAAVGAVATVGAVVAVAVDAQDNAQ